MPTRTDDQPIFRLPPFRVRKVSVAMSETMNWGMTSFGIPAVWSKSRGEGVKVAVLDTGAALNHPDLRDQVDEAKDFSKSDNGPEDSNGHGTHCAGIVAAIDDGRGVIGVAPRARLLIGKVLGNDGSGKASNIARGIRWAAESGAHIISMSFGSSSADKSIASACRYAASKGSLLIAAAGNEGPYENTVGYPGGFPETLCVAAIDHARKLARYSSIGSRVDLAAPGSDVLSCYPPRGYATLSGTSQATPFVSGVVALMIGRQLKTGSRTVTTAEQLKIAVRKTCIDVGKVGHDTGYGWGLVNPADLVG